MREAIEQVDQYAALYPRKWRGQIHSYWQQGRPIEGFSLIYGLRNHPHYGPQWLAKYRPSTPMKGI